MYVDILFHKQVHFTFGLNKRAKCLAKNNYYFILDIISKISTGVVVKLANLKIMHFGFDLSFWPYKKIFILN